MNGILNIYKEAGFTSFDVVAKLRGILKQRKIGHTGTLDPAATGVLPVCVGKATKLCELLTGGTKTYEAVLLLGCTTDTLDMEGQVIKTCPVECNEEEVRNCAEAFKGEIQQLPPMYSAIKINGRRLYELAREGKSVERKSRSVTIYELEILSIELPRVKMRVSCSKGTYIRTLCADMGESLGCGGCMESLVRTASGQFAIENAYTLSQVEELMKKGEIDSALLPMDRAFSKLEAYSVEPQLDKAVRNGSKIFIKEKFKDNEEIRLYDSESSFIGIYKYSSENSVLSPVKILYQE